MSELRKLRRHESEHASGLEEMSDGRLDIWALSEGLQGRDRMPLCQPFAWTE